MKNKVDDVDPSDLSEIERLRRDNRKYRWWLGFLFILLIASSFIIYYLYNRLGNSLIQYETSLRDIQIGIRNILAT